MKEIHVLLKDPSRVDEAVEILKEAGVREVILREGRTQKTQQDVVLACFLLGDHEVVKVLVNFLKPFAARQITGGKSSYVLMSEVNEQN